MTKNDFKKLLNLTINDTYFMFDNKYYKQKEGLSMGSPISGTLANIFLCHHESKWLNDCPTDFKPIYYRRYVDDTFVIFKKKDDAVKFLNYLNNQHQKISFTMETEQNNEIPFLDVLIKRSNRTIDISIYRKPSFSGLGVNFISKCYENFKLNTFSTMFYRAFRLSSSYENFHKEIEFLKTFFSQNGFIPRTFNKKLRIFLNNIFCPPPKKYGPKKQELFIKMPYFNDETNNFFKSKLNEIFNKYLPQIKPNIIFFNYSKIKNFVNHKERLPNTLDSMVVYLFSCPNCQLAYIGSTKECIFFRYQDH